MVTITEEGKYKPYVMDFGIVKEISAPGLTSTGMIIGTPYYLSPELARNNYENLDRRSDIFSMGVTLYELFTGKFPFNGNTSVAILMEVIKNEPPPIKKINPKIPRDVETIIMKCMEKDPNRRYNSAKSLAEDIKRYLEGDPITARPITLIFGLREN